MWMGILFKNFLKIYSQNYNLPQVGFRSSSLLHVINGVKADYEPWVVEILINFRDVRHHHCGGALIHSQWVLTAAHCFFDDENHNKLHVPVQNFEILIGSARPYDGKRYEIEKIIHADFKLTSFGLLNDIALVKLSERVPGTVAAPVRLPKADRTYTGHLGYIFGWGETTNYGEYSDYLLQGKVYIIPNDQSIDLQTITDPKKLCGDPQLTKSMCCGGDSGGPMVVKDENDKYVLVGISSYGDVSCDKTDVYARVSAYLDWISKHTGVAI